MPNAPRRHAAQSLFVRFAACLLPVVVLIGCQAPVARDAGPAPILLQPGAPMTAGDDEPTVNMLRLAPTDCRLYAQVDDLIKLRGRADGDPLGSFVFQQMGDVYKSPLWQQITADLGLDNGAMIDTYFGQSLAVMRGKVEGRTSTVFVTRVEPGDLERFASALSHRQTAPPTHQGRFAIFHSPKQKGESPFTFAASRRLLIFGKSKDAPWLHRVVDHVGLALDPDRPLIYAAEPPPTTDSLLNEPPRQKLFDKLPAQHHAKLYARNAEHTEQHAVAIVRGENDVKVHYAAIMPTFDELAKQFYVGQGVDFGILPDSTISAASINLMKKTPEHIQFFNLLLFPRSLQTHVLPKLSTPVVVFLGKVAGERVKPDPGFDVPAIGVAVRLKDPSVSADLDRLVMSLRFIANLSELDLASSFFESARLVPGPPPFRVADFGNALVKQIDDDRLKRWAELPTSAGLTQLSFGRIGDWYVVCSQEAFFEDCVAAHQNAQRRLTSTSVFTAIPMQQRDGLLASGVSRAAPLSDLLAGIAEYWRDIGAGTAPDDPKAEKRIEEVERPLRQVAEAIETTHSFSVQFWRDKQGHLRGQIQFKADDVVPR